MITLEQLLGRLDKARGGVGTTRWWLGPTPTMDRGMLPAAIAREVDLSLPDGALHTVSRSAAALSLSFFGTNTLSSNAYNRPRDPLTTLVRSAFSDLSKGAEFHSNGDWGEAWRTPGFSFRRLTEAAVDGGVIGFDAYRAFIFWVEE
jgi:hypothetical protein